MTQDHQPAWPIPADPGAPLHAEEDGNHIIVLNHHPDVHVVAQWHAPNREWLLPGATLPKSAGWAATFCCYISPVRSNAELRTAYERGLKNGREAALASIADIQQSAVDAAMLLRDAEVEAARRDGARQMRDMAAEVTLSVETTRPMEQIGTFYDPDALERWQRRLYAAAIQDLKLPGEPG